MPEPTLPEEELPRQLRWFVRIRWLFVAGLAAAVLFGDRVLRLEFPAAKTLATGSAVFGYNLLLFAYHRIFNGRVRTNLAAARVEAGLQIGLDLVALTALIHFTGGARSPFICLYLIHAIAGGLLLQRREAWLVGAGAFGLFLGLVLLEQAGVLPLYLPLDDAGALSAVALVVSLAFLVTLFCTMSITAAIMHGLRQREEQLVATQRALVKKSQDLELACQSLTEKQKQLVQTEKQASLGRLVAGIAHEINNPIQFIHGNMTILSEALTDVLPLLDELERQGPGLRVARLDYPFFRAQLPVLLKDMAGGAARIRAIVRDLRSFARRDEGRLDEEVDLNEVVRGSLRLLHNQLKHLTVEEELSPGLPPLRGNLTGIQQVVVNTLQNAIEALGQSPRGWIRIATQIEQGGSWVRLTVEDNGCGIPDAVKDRIFDPFFTTKQRSGGTGLGLAITEGIVQQHQGRIEVDSRVGQGTSFHFHLPRDRTVAATVPPPPPVDPSPPVWMPLPGPL